MLRLLFLVLCASLGFAPAVTAQTGALVGTVTDAQTGGLLPGANVRIEGTLYGAASERDGTYRIAPVPAGTHTVVVSYLGYAQAAQSVTVATGQTVRLDVALTPAAVSGSEVVVLGERAQGQALALTQQLNADQIVNIVAADQIGRFPDATAPEALQRVPGVGVQRDQGEGRFIQIRGAAPQLTTVTFNGERVPSPEGDVRQIALDAIPAEILQAIEVSKAITPDMDADAIGGSVNLVTRRAPARTLVTADVAGGYNTLRSAGAFRSALTAGTRAAGGRLGLLANVSFNRRNFGSDNIEPSYDFGDDDAPLGTDDDEDALDELEARYYSLLRQRLGVNTTLDYQLAPGSSLYLRGIFTQLQDTEQRRISAFTVEDDELAYLHKNRTEYLRTLNLTAGGEHALARGLQIDYHLTVSRSVEDTPEDVEIAFVQEDVAFDPDLSDPDAPRPNPAAGTLQNTSGYVFDVIEPSESFTSNTDYVAALNVGLPYRLGATQGRLRLGGKYRYKTKDQDVTNRAYEWDGDDDLTLGMPGADTPTTDLFDADYDFAPGTYPLPLAVTSNDQVLDFVDRYRDVLEADDVAGLEGDLEDFDATEQTLAGYVMTDLDLSARLRVIPGVRYEFTDLESTGYESIVEEEIDDEGDVSTDLVGIEAKTATNRYGYFFPMLHVRYRLTPRTNLRAAVTTTLARPNFYDLAPYRIQDDDEVEIGNPDLNPSRSVNLDLLAEHFTASIGVVSAGVFYKQITDPIVRFATEETSVITGEDLTVFQSRNGESGTIYGFEVAAQQQLRFLPGALAGLGVYANYTYTQSDATLTDGTEARFPGQADHLFNVALSYERRGFSGQVSLNYTGSYLDEFGDDGVEGNRALDIFVAERFGLDASATYAITPRVSVFGELLNLLNEPFVRYQGDVVRPVQREYYRSSGWLGVRLTY